MKKMVDIEVQIDNAYIDPKVIIQAREKNQQVENIIHAIEKASENDFPAIVASDDNGFRLISQRDIIRVYTLGRKLQVQTEEGIYTVKKSLSGMEEDLKNDRFIRISQSEIINIYKVKRFDINIAGTIGVEFDNGTKTWASRSCVRTLKEFLKGLEV